MSPGHERAAPLATALVVAGAVVWIARQWMPLGWTEKELAAAASRVWDVRRELLAHGGIPWWTPWFMGGSPYTLQHAQGLPLVAWLGLALGGLELSIAGKTVALLAIATSALTMFVCARRFLGSPWAAALAAVAYALHPQQAFRAGGDEHVGLSVAFALVPLGWLTWTRATESGTARSAFAAALALTALLWTSSKHALVLGLLLAPATAVRVWLGGRALARPALRGSALVLLLGAALGAFCIVPALEESRHARFFAGEDVSVWQRQLASRGLLGLVDRDGALSAPAMAAAEPVAVPDPAERAVRERISLLKFESGAKYAGIVLLALAAAALLAGRRRADRVLLGTLAVAFVACAAAATGLDALATAHLVTLRALWRVEGVPPSTRLIAAALPLLAVAALLVLAYRRRSDVRALGLLLALALLVWLPLFRIVAALPLFDGIRAPFVFYDIPATFVLCLMAGFFVTDVVESRWRAQTPLVTLALIALVLVDHAPAVRAFGAKPAAAQATTDVEAAYGALRDAEPASGKTYYVSTRNQHLLGPMYGGKAQVYEAWTKWMSPLGTGLLNERSWSSPQANRAYLDLSGARWIVFDKGDTAMMTSQLAREMLQFYRGWFQPRFENESQVVLDNPTAWPWLSTHRRAALFLGDVRMSPDLALALATRRLPLVHVDGEEPERPYAVAGGVYLDREGEQRVRALPSLQPLAIPLGGGQSVRMPEPEIAVRPADVRSVRRSNGDVALRIEMAEPGLLVVAESFHPHWRATVDGVPTRVARVSCGLMGLGLQAGMHDVRLRFEVPVAYWIAGIVSVATLGLGLMGARRRT